MTSAQFETLVAEAIDTLPEDILALVDNVAIVVGEWPSPAQLDEVGLGAEDTLFGLYVGVPRTKRGFTYGEIVPDKIVIFQRPIEMASRTRDQVRDHVRRTVLHEIGHHFGMDEDQLAEAGV